MCELLALSTSQPTRLTFSLHTLASRGGEAGSVHDGWGVAFYQAEDVALLREPHLGTSASVITMLDRILGQFEEFCVVTQSVRLAFPVGVRVLDQTDTVLHSS